MSKDLEQKQDLSNKNFFKTPMSADNPFARSIQAKKEEQEQIDTKKEKVVEVKGRKFLIKRWDSIEAMRKLPMVANLLFVPTMAPMMESVIIDENGKEEIAPELFSSADMMVNLFQRTQDAHWAEFVADMLDQTYIFGEKEPVNIREDLSPLEIIPVVAEVLQANFMMQLCKDLLAMTPNLLQVKEISQVLTK